MVYLKNEHTTSIAPRLNLRSSSILQTSQCMWLMQALGFLLSALPVEDILRNLHSLITPYIQQLEKLADETVRTPHPMCSITYMYTSIPKKERGSTFGLRPIGTGLVSVWCHCTGTFLCGTRLDLTPHYGLVSHMEVANAFSHLYIHTHTTARAKSSWRYIKVPTETHSELVMQSGR